MTEHLIFTFWVHKVIFASSRIVWFQHFHLIRHSLYQQFFFVLFRPFYLLLVCFLCCVSLYAVFRLCCNHGHLCHPVSCWAFCFVFHFGISKDQIHYYQKWDNKTTGSEEEWGRGETEGKREWRLKWWQGLFNTILNKMRPFFREFPSQKQWVILWKRQTVMDRRASLIQLL